MFEQISHYRPLTEPQRLAGRHAAREAHAEKVLGPRPTRDDFDDYVLSRFSPGIRWGMVGLTIVLVIVGFVPSAMRIYQLASTTFGRAIPDTRQMTVAGVMVILMAEIATLIFSTAARVLGTRGRLTTVLVALASLSAVLAITGNIQMAMGIDSTSKPLEWLTSWGRSLVVEPFAALEAILPPLFVLGGAFVLAEIILESQQRRHAAEEAYRLAVADYDRRAANPEGLPGFIQTWANVLWDAWRKGKRREALEAISPDVQRLIVAREMQADNWFQEISEIAGNSSKGESGKKARSTVSVSQVLQFLRDEDGAEGLTGVEIAEITGASQATVSRARNRFQNNGHVG